MLAIADEFFTERDRARQHADEDVSVEVALVGLVDQDDRIPT